jgi:uncharacterized protein (UPF0332 family)
VTPENRRRFCETMMRRARRALGTAQGDLELVGDHGAATSRAYYAMFYAASALLGARDVVRSRHGGVVSAFGELFVKTGDMDPELGKTLRKAYESRLGCDYDAEHEEARESAESTIADARVFVEAAKQRLKIEFAEEAP